MPSALRAAGCALPVMLQRCFPSLPCSVSSLIVLSMHAPG